MSTGKRFSLTVRTRTMIWSVAATVVWSLLINMLFMSSLGQDINYRLATTVEFRLRDALGQAPSLDPRIRIFGFDDKTLSIMKRPELYIEEWADGIVRLAKDKPKVIVIDKMFSIIYDPNQKAREALAKLSKIDVPVVVGSFVTGGPIPYRDQLNYNKNLYHLPYIKKNGIDLHNSPTSAYQASPQENGASASAADDSDELRLKKFENYYIYGPTRAFQEVFPYIGHLQYSGQTRAAPLIQVNKEFAIPHASVFAADSYRIKEGEFYVNDHLVPLDLNGDVIVNIANPQTYYQGQRRLNLIMENRNKEKLVNEGDIVLLLLSMYTGGTDFHQTPYGYAPGGFILAAMMHSAITGQWLHITNLNWFYITLSCIIGGMLGALTATLTFWTTLILGLLIIVACGVISFSYLGLVIPWLWLIFGFLGSAIVVFAEKTRFTEKRAQRLQLVEAERKLLAKELKEASVMAEAYRPDSLPSWPRFLIGGYHKPIHAASGDWYAFETSESGRFHHLIMCDITGHGVQAALVVSACKTLLGNIKRLKPDLLETKDFNSEYMQLLNATLWRQGRGQHVTTLLTLTFEPQAQRLYYMAAGHPFPLLRSQENVDERPRPLISRHNPLGITEDCLPIQQMIALHPGDEVLAFTDGIPLPENRKLLKLFPPRGADNIEGAAQELYHLVWAREKERHGRTPDDDVSMVWFKFVG